MKASKKLRTFSTAMLAALTLVWSADRAPAQSYPSGQVTIVLPTTPGTSMDTLGRFLAEGLSKKWGTAVIFENRPGAGGALGAAYVSKADPDGLTILITSNTFTTNAATNDELPYDAEADFTPLAMVARGDMGVFGGTRVPAKTLAELVEYAKTNEVFFGTTGPTAASHFATKQLEMATGITMTPVNYKGATDALVDIAGGRLDLYVGAVATAMPSLDNPGIIPLAILGPKRSPALPDVPTATEAGFTGADFDLWFGLFGPANVSAEVASQINADVYEVMTAEGAEERLSQIGLEAARMEPADFATFVATEIVNLKAMADGAPSN